MLDIKWIRDNPEAFVKGLTDRGFANPKAKLEELKKLDDERRETIALVQGWQEQRNRLSSEIGEAKKAKDEARANALLEQVSRLKSDLIHGGEKTVKNAEQRLEDSLAAIPNIPAQDVPVGPDEKSNVELRAVGTKPKFDFVPKQHFELGEALGLMDFETAAKLSGARFVVLKGPMARLERALAQFMLDLHTSEHGYTEINPPLLVHDETMFGTAQLPKFKDDQFQAGRSVTLEEATDTEIDFDIEKLPDNVIALVQRRWLIPTAEVPLTNLVREEIVEEAKLPIRVTAGTPCFRAEAGAAGKDTRGMIRQHQFNKVELVSVTTPEQSQDEHERMTASAEEVLKRLGLPYRVVVLSTGDMGFAAQKTYDIEVWLPGQGAYREISSCSNCGDFQARRMNARYRPKDAKQPRLVHTLNGSGVAVGRALIAVLENYQDKDGSIRIPEALQPYMGDLTKIAAPR